VCSLVLLCRGVVLHRGGGVLCGGSVRVVVHRRGCGDTSHLSLVSVTVLGLRDGRRVSSGGDPPGELVLLLVVAWTLDSVPA